jgi:putative flippase GtrA
VLKLYKIRGQLFKFLIVGGVAVLLDAIFYWILLYIFNLDAAISKRISFIIGALWAYIGNKYFTFSANTHLINDGWKFALVYFSSFVINSITHDVYLQFHENYSVAFIAATGLSAVTNFIGQKLFVFHE